MSNYWRPFAPAMPAIRKHVIRFEDAIVPVMTYLRPAYMRSRSSLIEFDPYVSFLRTSDRHSHRARRLCRGLRHDR